ncbi:MAG: hypothetical protein JSU85_09360 [Candidatus Zixiibacteriota bacterium]|nr:MAG: hypothetical protein JSU85_09360 [candidate division Zixibacteria bacterium]
MSKDTTSWEIDSVNMKPCFASDSTIWCYEPTLIAGGNYFVKFKYYIAEDPTTALYLGGAHFVSDVQMGISSNRDTLFVYDSSDTTAISVVTVTVYPDGGGGIMAQAGTNANGRMIIGLPDGAYDYYLYKQGYNFNNYDNVTIAGDQTDTLWGTAFADDPGPSNMTAIITWLLTPNGDTIYPSYLKYQLVDSAGNVFADTIKVTYGTGVNTVLLSTGEIEITADSSRFSFSLYANENLSITSSQYKFTVRYVYQRRPYLNTTVTTQIPDTSEAVNPFWQ